MKFIPYDKTTEVLQSSEQSFSPSAVPIRFRQLFGENTSPGVFSQRHFMRRRACHLKGEKKASSACHCHDFGVLATLNFTNGSAPFFAGSSYHVDASLPKSNLPRALKPSSKMSNTVSNTPSSSTLEQSEECLVWLVPLWQIFPVPARKIHRIPFKMARGR